MTCRARQYGDTTMCGPCGVQWDTHDPDPPKCRKLKGHGLSIKLERLDESTALAPPPPPATIEARIPVDSLPPDLAAGMAHAYDGALKRSGSPAAAMQIAYRLFLSRLP